MTMPVLSPLAVRDVREGDRIVLPDARPPYPVTVVRATAHPSSGTVALALRHPRAFHSWKVTAQSFDCDDIVLVSSGKDS